MNYRMSTSVFAFNFLVGKCGMGYIKEWVIIEHFHLFKIISLLFGLICS